MKVKNWAFIHSKACKLACVAGVVTSLGLGYLYTKSAITQNETLVTYNKIWNQYYRHLYPLKLEYFTIIGTRALTDAIKPPQDSLLYKLSKWIRIKTYEKAANTVPADDLLLYILKLNTEIDTQYVNEQNVGEMYDQLIAMAKTSMAKKILLRNKSCEDNQIDEKIQHSMFIIIILDEMSSTKFLNSLKFSEPIKHKQIDKEFCSLSKTLSTDLIYIPFPLGGICLASIFNKYIADYEITNGCTSADMKALIKQFNVTIQELEDCNKYNLDHNYNSKDILEGPVGAMMFVRNGISSICPNRAKEFKPLPNNLM